MSFIRLVIFGFLALSVIYVSLSVYFRSVRRENLEEDWAENHPDGGDPSERSAYIEHGMTEYAGSIRKRLVLLVYIVPIAAIAVIQYLTN